jgi:hypothetical protein
LSGSFFLNAFSDAGRYRSDVIEQFAQQSETEEKKA